jgi:putative membrane protein
MRVWKIISLLVGFGLLYWIVSDIDLSAVGTRVLEVGVFGIALVIGIYLLAFLGDSISWLLILTSLPMNFAWVRRTFVVRLVGEAFNNTVPAGGFAGEPVKAVILKSRYGVSYTDASASIVMARTVNMIALIVFLLIGFVFMAMSDAIGGPLKVTASAGLAFLSVGTVLMFVIQRYRASSWIMARFHDYAWGERAAGAVKVIEELDHRFVTFYTHHRRRLTASLVLAFVNWALGVAEIYVTFLFLGHEISWADAWMIEALAQMIRAAVFFIPLGIGAQEGAFVVISSAITGVPSLGLACAAVRRIREISWIALGLLAWIVYPTAYKMTDKAGLREDD